MDKETKLAEPDELQKQDKATAAMMSMFAQSMISPLQDNSTQQPTPEVNMSDKGGEVLSVLENVSTQPDMVISVLEGENTTNATETISSGQNYKDINLLHENVQQTDQENKMYEYNEKGTARMPQTTAPPQMSASQEFEKIKIPNDSDNLCPLENENDIVPNKTALAQDLQNENLKDLKDEDLNFEKQLQTSQPSVMGQTMDIKPEKVISDQQMKMTQDSNPVTTDDLFDKMVERMEYESQNQSSKMEIQLKPDFLGKVSIQLSLGENGLHAKINADDPSVRGLINSQINQLVETLSDKGVKIAAMDVVYTAVNDQNLNQDDSRQRSNQQAAQKSQRNTGITGAKDLSYSSYLPDNFMHISMENSMLDSALSSVEYTA